MLKAVFAASLVLLLACWPGRSEVATSRLEGVVRDREGLPLGTSPIARGGGGHADDFVKRRSVMERL